MKFFERLLDITVELLPLLALFPVLVVLYCLHRLLLNTP